LLGNVKPPALVGNAHPTRSGFCALQYIFGKLKILLRFVKSIITMRNKDRREGIVLKATVKPIKKQKDISKLSTFTQKRTT